MPTGMASGQWLNRKLGKAIYVRSLTLPWAAAYWKWVNIFLYDGGIVPDPDGIITGGHGNQTACTIAIRQGEEINAPALTAMFKQIITNNRAGGWRKLTAQRRATT